MISAGALYFGVNPASGSKEFSYAVIDDNLNLVKLADADVEELIAMLNERDSSFVAVNAPLHVNNGIVKRKIEKESSTPERSLRGVNIRMAEYELRERGITITGTPSHEELCPSWMRTGFRLYQELSKMGFKPFITNDASRQYLETNPYASFCSLLERIPFARTTLEGQLQRQLLLYTKDLRIKDGMDFFGEITRFKLVRGILPTDVLYPPEQLDVLVAAYTAWMAANNPDEITFIGDRAEGQLILPVRKLLEKYE